MAREDTGNQLVRELEVRGHPRAGAFRAEWEAYLAQADDCGYGYDWTGAEEEVDNLLGAMQRATVDDRVTLTERGIHCPVHGIVEDALFRTESPAPCGCDWVWEWRYGQAVLVAVPHRDDPLA
jgi:hypothetical protein